MNVVANSQFWWISPGKISGKGESSRRDIQQLPQPNVIRVAPTQLL